MKNSSNEKTESEWEKEKLDPNAWNQPRPSQQFNVIRRVYQQDALNKDADYQYPEKPLGYRCKKAVIGCGFGECLSNSIPILRWLPKYDFKANLMGDLIAGATTAVMHIPQGMAYALLAEVPPIVGLYMAFFPVLVYVVFGTSPHVSMGTFAVACLMAGKVVTQYSTHIDPGSAMNATAGLPISTAEMGVPIYSPQEVLSIVCLAVGIFQVLMWIMRLGAVSTLLSETLVSGFTTAASFHVLASQLKDLFGLKLPKLPSNYKVVYTVIEICKNITNVNVAAFVISFITCLVIALNNELLKPWLSKRCRVPMPIELIAIVVGTLVSRFADLKAVFGIGLIGSIPTGLPVPQVPPVELFPTIAIDAFTITMVTYTISMSMSLIFAAKEKYEVDANQELLALGASNVFGSFFSCAPMCASLSRSYIQYQAGSKTGITSVVSSLLILCVLLWVGPFFELLPRCVLASIIVVSLKGMFMQVKELAKFWKLSKLDAVVWLVTFLITVLVNIDIGLGAGLLASVGALFCRSQKPYTCLLGRVLDTDLYLDTKRYRAAEELPGVKIFHYCGGLNFASKNLFRETLFRKIGYLKPTEVVPDDDNNLTKSDSYEWDPTIGHRVQCVIIDATALSYVDAPGVKTLVAVQRELVSSNITVLLAGANGRIVAGWPAADGQIPHQISLRMVSAAGAVSSCGGSVIHHNWVITAAHCVANRITFVIRFGLTNLTEPQIILETTRKYIHPRYIEIQAGVQTDDIALLGVDQHIPYGPYIQPCRLQNSQQKNLDYTGVRFTVSGYGRTDDLWNGGAASEILLWVHLRGITNEECRRWYGGSPIVQDQTICAEYYNNTAQSSCQGDSGGPLTKVDVDGQPTMVGIVSFGSSQGCNSPWPSAYVRPGHYHDWYVSVTGINFDWRNEDLLPPASSEEDSSSNSSDDSSSDSSSSSSSEEAKMEPIFVNA